MAFDLSQIKRKTVTRQDDIKSCHWAVKNMDILTENVKYALWKYAEFRFTKRNRGRLTGNSLTEMIKELLEYCCNKSYNSISLQDVSNNENKILFEIKKAIYYGATRCLYDINADIMKIDLEAIQAPIQVMSKENVIDYFEGLWV